MKAIGYTDQQVEIALDPQKPTLPMYGYKGDLRPEKVRVRIPRKYIGGASNDVGFRWNGQTYEAIISEFDYGCKFTEEKVKRLTQQYAFCEVKRQAFKRGYQVQTSNNADGSIRVVLQRR